MIEENIDYNIIQHPRMRHVVTLQVIRSCGHSESMMHGDEQVAETEAEHMCYTPCAICVANMIKKVS